MYMPMRRYAEYEWIRRVANEIESKNLLGRGYDNVDVDGVAMWSGGRGTKLLKGDDIAPRGVKICERWDRKVLRRR